MSVNTFGWIAFAFGNVGMLLVPRTRHGWVLTLAAALTWAWVDIRLSLWSGLVSAGMALVVNTRCWLREVSGRSVRNANGPREAADAG